MKPLDFSIVKSGFRIKYSKLKYLRSLSGGARNKHVAIASAIVAFLAMAQLAKTLFEGFNVFASKI